MGSPNLLLRKPNRCRDVVVWGGAQQVSNLAIAGLTYPHLSGPYRAMRGAIRCERRCVLNTKRRCDAMQKSWRCAFSLQKSSAMRSHDAKTLAMRCHDAGHSDPHALSKPLFIMFGGGPGFQEAAMFMKNLESGKVVLEGVQTPLIFEKKSLRMGCAMWSLQEGSHK